MTIDDCPVWPRPRLIKLTGSVLKLARPLTVRTKGRADWLAPGASAAVEILNRAAGTKVLALGKESKGPALTITPGGQAKNMPPAATKPEGYVLDITVKGVELTAADAAGLQHGVHTLAQLLRPEGSHPALPAGLICDWPQFPVRGAHVFLPSRGQIPFFLGFIDYLASLKFNTLFLELAAGMEFQRHPEINAAWSKFHKLLMNYDPRKDPRPETFRGDVDYKKLPSSPTAPTRFRYFPKDGTHFSLGEGDCLGRSDIERLIEHCRARQIEIIPEVQSLSHCYWLCIAHPEIREREDDPFPDTYCPSNPRTYELLFDVMDEVIEVFQPRSIHIGHDECYTYGVCPACRQRSGPDLLADDVRKIHDHLSARGVSTMMWGDGLINPKENPRRPDVFPLLGGVEDRREDPVTGKVWTKPAVWPAVKKIPKDVMIVDWYWEYEERSEHHFAGHGLKQIFGNFSPFLCDDWDQRSSSPNVKGAEVSSWCAPTVEAFAHNGVPHACFATADLLWHGRQLPREEVWHRMARAMPAVIDDLAGYSRWLTRGEGEVSPVDVSDQAELVPHIVVGRLKTGSQISPATGRGRFDVLATENGYLQKALILDNIQRRLTVPIGRKASHLLVLQGTTMTELPMEVALSHIREPATLVQYTITYADGRKARFDARFGRHIAPVFDHWPMPGRRWIWSFCHEAVPVELDGPFKLFAQEWANPRPGTAIKSLTLELAPAVSASGEVIVPAISLVE